MTAQIRPNRLEVNDRFPMLGFSIKADQPGVEAEVTLATDIDLFKAENRQLRTAANFYTSRESGQLAVPRGEGVFVVPPDILARFVGRDRLFFGLASGKPGNGGLQVDALPREGSPFVSLRGLTGRTLRRPSLDRRRPSNPPLFDWAGDAAKPGSEPSATPAQSAAPAAPADPSAALAYDDGFGKLPTRRSALVHPMARVDMIYTPSDPSQAATALADFSRREANWRAGVPDTSFFPHSAICHMVMTSPSGTSYYGTGFYVASDLILTVAHNLYEMASVRIFAGRNGENSFLTDFTAGPSDWTIHPSYTPNVTDFDLAVIRVSTPQPAGLSFTLEELLVSQASPIIVCGYGAETVDPFKQHLDGDHIREVSSNGHVIRYNLQTEKGNSGSPVFYVDVYEDDVRRQSVQEWKLVGVHSAGHDNIVNQACALTQAKINWIYGRGLAAAQGMGAPQRAPRRSAAMSSDFDAKRAIEWAMEKVRQGVAAVASACDPPSVYRIPADWRDAFLTAWSAATILQPALRPIPDLARELGVTLSVGPAFDTPIAGAGVGAVFAPDGDIGLFGYTSSSLDLDGITDFIKSLKLVVQAKFKLGYNHSGIAGFESIRKAAGVSVGAEIVVGSEIWLDGNDHGLGGAVTIGAGFAFQLSEDAGAIVPPTLPGDQRARAQRMGGAFGDRVGQAIDLGYPPKALDPMLDLLDPPAAPVPLSPPPLQMSRAQSADEILMPPPPAPRARAMSGAEAAIAIGGFLLETVRDSVGDVTWELDQFANRKHPNDVVPTSPAPYKDAPTIKLDSWPVSGGLVDDISAWFAIDWQYNGTSLGNVRIGNIGTNDAIGWSLHVRAQIMDNNILYEPGPCAALRVRLHYRFSRSIGSDQIAITDINLYGDGTHDINSHWVQAETFAAAQTFKGDVAVELIGVIAGQLISSSDTDISYALDRFENWKRPKGLAENAPIGTIRRSTKTVEWDDGGILDAIGMKVDIEWQHDGTSLGHINMTPYGFNDARGDSLVVTGKILNDFEPYYGIPTISTPAEIQAYQQQPGARLRIQLHYRKSRYVRSDQVYVITVTLLPDGNSYSEGKWMDNDFF